MSLHFYIIDTETSGLMAGHHEMTEIGIIRAQDRMQLHRCIKCIYPERANIDALTITKKTIADLEEGYEKSDVVAECNKFFNEDGATPAHRVIIAHNANFDRRFLHALWEDQGLEFPAHLWMCTMQLSKEYAKKIGLNKSKVNLHAACELVGIKKFAEAHNAKIDSRNCYLLQKNLIEEKKIDYLPFIKNIPHLLKTSEYDDVDLSILNDIDE